MSEEVKNDEQREPIQSVSRVLPEVFLSRVLEYLPLPGTNVISRDCTYDGKSYSKGSIITMSDGRSHTCSGNKDGEWLINT